jgi:NADH:ubiquinone reductase (H+-translocating)
MEGVKKKIVILGAGFGGVKAAFELCKKLDRLKLGDKYKLTLVDKNKYHTYTPTLYEIATTSKDLANQIELKHIVTFHLDEIFEEKNITILNNMVSKVDLIEGDIHFQDSNKLKFDYLVLALGAEPNYFGIPGLQENSLPLKTFMDALKIRDAIWSKVEEGAKRIRIVIGGGGSTGVELAGEIKSWLCQLEQELSKCDATVSIIEGMPTVLNGFNERIVNKVTKRLQKIGVELLTGEFIAKAEPNKITLKSGRIVESDILIWTGGVKAASLMGELPLKKEQRGKIVAESQMECLPQSPDLKLYGKIYGLGDAICFYNPTTNKPIPLLAEAAINGAEIVAHNIVEDIKVAEGIAKKARHKIFTPKDEYPYVIPVGGKYAVAKLGPLVISGFAGWVLKGFIELYYMLFNVLPPLKALRVWLKGLAIFVKNDRLG